MPTSVSYFRTSFIVLLCSSLFMGSCSKEGTNAEEKEQFPTDNAARSAAKKLYMDFYVSSQSNGSDIPWTGDEPSCDPGNVPQATRDKILMRLEYYRKAAGLNNIISENANKSQKAQQAALMMNANNELDHFPPSGWKCYTDDGKDGAGSSLLTMTKNAEAIDSYVRDQGSNNGPVGHRRWLLWPRLQEIGIGNTDRSNAIWVLGNPGSVPTDAPEFIAWPPEGYIPDRMVFPRWSFSIKDADFTNTTVSMRDSSGQTVSLQLEELDNQFGDRTIVWVPQGIVTNVTEDTVYTVTLQGVNVNDELRDYEYTVILFDLDS